MVLYESSITGKFMNRLLPPLTALRTFEAVARHQNFSRAAEELNITQSAVSHQIRVLEDFLGERLINRKDKPMTLTRAGHQLFPCIEEALSSVSACVSQLMGRSEGIVRLGAFMHFALKSLITKLPDFRSRYPNFDLRLEMLTDSSDPNQTKSDVVILVNKQPPGYDCRLLRQETWFPVCSPAIYDSLAKAKDIKALFQYPFLCLENAGEWILWSEAADITFPRTTKFHRFSHLILCVQAAVEGQGIALGVNSLVEEDIRAGRLKKLPFDSEPVAWQHFLCVKKEKRGDPGVQLLARWLMDSLGEDIES
jgi:LysR family transcriptional regulator, glycine cleavage system transcriptional activator